MTQSSSPNSPASSGNHRIEHDWTGASDENAFGGFGSIIVPFLFLLFFICMAQLNCYIEQRRFGPHDNTSPTAVGSTSNKMIT